MAPKYHRIVGLRDGQAPPSEFPAVASSSGIHVISGPPKPTQRASQRGEILSGVERGTQPARSQQLDTSSTAVHALCCTMPCRNDRKKLIAQGA
eukprot:2487071-Pleurochrysis_carterae.AAC.3